MATKYGCDVVVVVPQDGAWANDPFAASPDYRLAETATTDGGFTCGSGDVRPLQIPANQLKPCLLQNVSENRW